MESYDIGMDNLVVVTLQSHLWIFEEQNEQGRERAKRLATP